MCGFDGVQKANFFDGEPFRRGKVDIRVRKLKNGKAAGRDEVTGEMIVVDWIWRANNMDIESGVIPVD